ncbi:hypothetical protein ACFX2B_023329 [Malus domestica]
MMNPRKPISIDTGNAVVRELGAADGGGAGELTSAETASTMLATILENFSEADFDDTILVFVLVFGDKTNTIGFRCLLEHIA